MCLLTILVAVGGPLTGRLLWRLNRFMGEWDLVEFIAGRVWFGIFLKAEMRLLPLCLFLVWGELNKLIPGLRLMRVTCSWGCWGARRVVLAIARLWRCRRLSPCIPCVHTNYEPLTARSCTALSNGEGEPDECDETPFLVVGCGGLPDVCRKRFFFVGK